MKSFFEFMSLFNWIALPLTLVQSLTHANYGRAMRKHGALGVMMEAGSALLGTNAYPFFIPSESEWSGAQVGRLLGKFGVKIWDVGYFNGEMFFRVRKDQAAWAQRVMMRAGVPLTHRLYGGE